MARSFHALAGALLVLLAMIASGSGDVQKNVPLASGTAIARARIRATRTCRAATAANLAPSLGRPAALAVLLHTAQAMVGRSAAPRTAQQRGLPRRLHLQSLRQPTTLNQELTSM
jgi:hypothetical protein